MATFSDLKTYVARDLRDTGNDVWSTDELGDLINQGIDAIADVRPKEIVQTIGTVAAATYTYAASDYEKVYRLDIYTAAGSYDGELPEYTGDGADSGYQLINGVVYLPVGYPLTVGDTLRAFGYGRYVQLSADTATTDLSQSLIWALRVFCQSEAFGRLLADRSTFQQWQSTPGNTDVTATGLAQLYLTARRRWQEERARIRRMRRV